MRPDLVTACHVHGSSRLAPVEDILKSLVTFFVAAGLLVGCTPTSPLPPKEETSAAEKPASPGEKAPFRVEGSIVKVNNRLCAVSRTRMAEGALGQFVSRVAYKGPSERFRGRIMVFNQCCAGCVQTFPKLWAERSEEILSFHGLLPQG